MLQRTSGEVLVPLTVGGGIRTSKIRMGGLYWNVWGTCFYNDIMVVLDIQMSLMGGALLISSLFMKWDIARWFTTSIWREHFPIWGNVQPTQCCGLHFSGQSPSTSYVAISFFWIGFPSCSTTVHLCALTNGVTLWEKPLMAAADQFLEQNRHSQTVRRLLDSNRENGCKE